MLSLLTLINSSRSAPQLLGFHFPGFKLKFQMLLIFLCVFCQIFLAGGTGTPALRFDMRVAFHLGWGTGAGVACGAFLDFVREGEEEEDQEPVSDGG